MCSRKPVRRAWAGRDGTGGLGIRMQSFTRVGSCRILLTVAGLFVGGFHGLSAVAQVPSAEQIQIFQNLPPDQQRAILEALGTAGGAGGLGAASGATRSDQRVEPTQGAGSQARRRDETRTLSGEPRLKPDDTLIVELLPLEWQGQERVLTQRAAVATPLMLPGTSTGATQ